jgi:acetyl-CoA C-acetyltransferase
MTRFGSLAGLGGRELLVDAFQDLRGSVDRGLDPREIEAIYLGNFSSELFERQGHSAPIAAEWLGLLPRPAQRIEDACASGGVALRQGIMAIASGLYDVVLVAGVEKMTHLPTAAVTDLLITAADMHFEAPAGFTFPGFYGAMATAYLHRYALPAEALMQVAIKNHANGALNPKAHLSQTIEAVMTARRAAITSKGQPDPGWQDTLDFLRDPRANPPVAWPLRLFDCSPVSDGAAAVLLAREDLAHRFSAAPLEVVGTGQASGGALHTRSDITCIPSAAEAARQAYGMAGLRPEQITLAEVHDCFTIAEMIAMEDLGFYPAGQAGFALLEGQTALDGPRPINTSGGLKAKGHPVGASGVAQVVELWKQMRGEAGTRQVPGAPEFGLAHNVGGSGQTAAVTIFARR